MKDFTKHGENTQEPDLTMNVFTSGKTVVVTFDIPRKSIIFSAKDAVNLGHMLITKGRKAKKNRG